MAVITISRQKGSLGTEIAREVAGQLQCEYLDRERIEQGLTAHGLAVSEIDKFDEKEPHFWADRLIQGRKFFNALQIEIYEAARRGNVVIVGRGGQVLLKGLPGVLHVRIIAPFQDRVLRLMARDGGSRKEILHILKQSDRDSGGFIRAFLAADWEHADFYDLTINTLCLPVDEAADMILRAIPAVEAMKDTERSRERLDELIHQKKVETVLLNAKVRNIRAEVARGVVTLHGTVFSGLEGRGYARLVSGVEGTQKVESNMTVHMPVGT